MVEAVIRGGKLKIQHFANRTAPISTPTGLHSDQWPHRGGTERDVAEQNQTPKKQDREQ